MMIPLQLLRSLESVSGVSCRSLSYAGAKIPAKTQNIINGHKLKCFIPLSGELPELLSLPLPIFLLDRVINTHWGLRPGVHEGVYEGFVEPKLFLELSIELFPEP